LHLFLLNAIVNKKAVKPEGFYGLKINKPQTLTTS